MTSAAFPWRDVMAFGLGVLRMNPEHFWRATPREMQAASEAFFAAPALAPSRSSLNDLMTLFPDRRAA